MRSLIENIKILKKQKLNLLLSVILASSGLFLLINEYPYFGIGSFALLLFFGIIFLFFKGSFASDYSLPLKILLVMSIYFILSYFISNQTVANFFSFNFFRYDGNIFFCYLPFFALSVPFFSYEKVAKIYVGFIFITFTLLAVAGIIGLLLKNYSFIFLYNGSEGPMLVGLNHAHNATGSGYAMASILALSFTLRTKGKIKIFYGIILLLCVAGLIMTQSRGAIAGFIAGILFVVWLNFRSVWKFAIFIGALALVAIPLVFLTGFHERIMQLIDFSNWTVGTRIDLWKKAILLFKQSPIFGVGFGRFNDVMYNVDTFGASPIRLDAFVGVQGLFKAYILPNYSFNSAHAHNGYLQFLAEAGVVGLGLIISFWVICFRKMLAGYNATRNEFARSIFLTSLGSIIALFVMSFTENYFSATTILMFISMIVSLSIGITWEEKKNKCGIQT